MTAGRRNWRRNWSRYTHNGEMRSTRNGSRNCGADFSALPALRRLKLPRGLRHCPRRHRNRKRVQRRLHLRKLLPNFRFLETKRRQRKQPKPNPLRQRKKRRLIFLTSGRAWQRKHPSHRLLKQRRLQLQRQIRKWKCRSSIWSLWPSPVPEAKRPALRDCSISLWLKWKGWAQDQRNPWLRRCQPRRKLRRKRLRELTARKKRRSHLRLRAPLPLWRRKKSRARRQAGTTT